MNLLKYKLLILLFGLLALPVQSESLSDQKSTLYFGVPMNYPPFIHVDKNKEVKGLLIDSITALCVEIKRNCIFTRGSFHKRLESLKALEIHGLLVIDSVLLPEVDQVVHTKSLCKISPVFIQTVSEKQPAYKSPKDLEKTTIGVLVDSLYHLYLLDNHYMNASIKPYNLLESGLFDLISGRVDSLFAEKTFYQERVAKTPLSKAFNVQAVALGDVKFEHPTMSLVLRKNTPDLLNSLNAAIEKNNAADDCDRMIYKRAARTHGAR